jgi:hypothetical protein
MKDKHYSSEGCDEYQWCLLKNTRIDACGVEIEEIYPCIHHKISWMSP